MPQGSAGDRFVLERQVAAGAMGVVYKAWDRRSGVDVAVKLLHAPSSPQARRFEREAELLSTLSHPSIVRYVAHGTNPAGERFLVMEWLEGESLEDRLARQALTASESLSLVEQALEGCAAAHRAGIVHRDLKPANLLLVDGRVDKVKIADFGIARRLTDLQRLTLPGSVIGTPLYMSPEQARGDFATDARSDVFSLGCVLFECLTGQSPFVGSSLMAILAKIILESPAQVRDLRPRIPASVDALVQRMLIKERSARPEAQGLIADMRVAQHELAAAGEGFASLRPRRVSSIPSVQALGKRGEQRVICVVFVGGHGPEPMPQTEVVSSGDATTLDAPPSARMAPRRVIDALLPYGARVDQLLDGSMIVTLSGSSAPTDQAVQAARCALTLRSLIPDTPMALCTGRAVLGGQVPLGAVIDNGVRLLEMSAMGMIRLDDATAGLLEGRFAIAAYCDRPELRHELLDDDGPRTLLGKVTPCVGRERDLEMLDRAVADCIAESSPRVVLITAPAGAGKSRLRRELVARVRRDGPELLLLSGRADSMHCGSPYALLTPALRRLVGIEHGDSPEAKREKVRARVGRRLSPDKARRAVEFVGELMGVQFVDHHSPVLAAARQDPRLMADQILASWLDWLEAECTAGPVLIVLDDLHWGDLPSVQLLDASLRALETQALLVIGFARTNLSERFPDLFRERHLLTARLGRLPRGACAKLIEDALGERVPSDKLAWIVQRADGNAFYLEQLIIAMASGASEGELPDTVLGMVQARVDGLGEDGKRVLRAASVFGDAFAERGVRAWLPVLLKQEVIDRKGDPRDDDFVFRSSLLRDAAYAMLTEQDRALGHRLAAQWLEGQGDSSPLVLAQHFERGGDAVRATNLYQQAAERALEANDFARVIHCADRGIACGAEGELLGNALLLRAEAHRHRGELGQTESETREALGWLVEGTSSWYRAADALIATVALRGDLQAAERCGQDMLAKARGVRLDAPRMISMLCAAGNLMMVGQRHLAERMVDHVRRHSGDASTERARGYLHAIEAQLALVTFAEPTSFLRLTRLALESFQRAEDLRSFSWQQVNLGYALIELGQHDEAEAALEEALAAADRMGISAISASARQNLALVHALRGAFEVAECMLNSAIELFRPQADLRQEGACRMYLSRVLVARGNLVEAESEAHKAIDLFANLPNYRIPALATLAHALSAGPRVGEALSAALAAMDLLEATGSVDEGEAFVRLVHVRALRRSGEVERARRALDEAERRIVECANKISEHGLRASFLDYVPDNRAILDLASAGR